MIKIIRYTSILLKQRFQQILHLEVHQLSSYSYLNISIGAKYQVGNLGYRCHGYQKLKCEIRL